MVILNYEYYNTIMTCQWLDILESARLRNQFLKAIGGCSVVTWLTTFVVMMHVVSQSVLNIDHMDCSNPYQSLMVNGSLYLWISLRISHPQNSYCHYTLVH